MFTVLRSVQVLVWKLKQVFTCCDHSHCLVLHLPKNILEMFWKVYENILQGSNGQLIVVLWHIWTAVDLFFAFISSKTPGEHVVLRGCVLVCLLVWHRLLVPAVRIDYSFNLWTKPTFLVSSLYAKLRQTRVVLISSNSRQKSVFHTSALCLQLL